MNAILIYPPWSRFSFSWNQLPFLFMNPDLWTSINPVNQLKSLGYSVSSSDHEFISDHNGGGLIVVKRDLQRWFPAALIRDEASFRPPPGFGMSKQSKIKVLISRITSEHKMGFKPIPAAPSPRFSVEEIKHDGNSTYLAIGSANRPVNRFLDSLATFFDSVQVLSETPDLCTDVFSQINNRSLCYEWIRIELCNCDVTLLIAKIISCGLNVECAVPKNVTRVHIFIPSSRISNLEFSAKRWSNAPVEKNVERADQW